MVVVDHLESCLFGSVDDSAAGRTNYSKTVSLLEAKAGEVVAAAIGDG